MSVPTVKLRHGSPVMVDHTPGSAVTGGDVVVVGDELRIAHNDIDANKLGALAAGGGVYEFPKDANAIADGKIVYWDAGNKQVTETKGANKLLGRTAKAADASDGVIDVLHDPAAGAGS